MALDLHRSPTPLSFDHNLNLDALQGLWTVEQYLRLTEYSRTLLEFNDGVLEAVPMPTDRHQAILLYLLVALRDFVVPRGGRVRCAPLRLRTIKGRVREPDILALLDAKDPRRRNDYWRGADLVIEIVSPDDPDRDLVTKRAEYAAAAIPEYWIVQPDVELITVLHRAETAYAEHDTFRRGDTLTSPLLPDLALSVTEILSAD
jgi:Uma2 family endonuclease